MTKQLSKKPALILTVPVDYDGTVQVIRSDGKVLYDSTLPIEEQNLGDDSSNPGGPPPPPPGGDD